MSELESLAAGMVIQYSTGLNPEPSDNFKMRASELAREIELESTVNRAPRMIAAGSVYLTSLARGSGYTQDDISKAYDCSDVGLRHTYRDIAETDGWEIQEHANGQKTVRSTAGRVMGGATREGKRDEEHVNRLVRFFGAIQDKVSFRSEAKADYEERAAPSSDASTDGELLGGKPRWAGTEDKYEAIEQACLELHNAGVEKARCREITEVTNEILEERGFQTSLRSASMSRFLSAGKFERWSDEVTIGHERDPPGAGWWHIEVAEVPEP